jgi:hypothetical protein
MRTQKEELQERILQSRHELAESLSDLVAAGRSLREKSSRAVRNPASAARYVWSNQLSSTQRYKVMGAAFLGGGVVGFAGVRKSRAPFAPRTPVAWLMLMARPLVGELIAEAQVFGHRALLSLFRAPLKSE